MSNVSHRDLNVDSFEILKQVITVTETKTILQSDIVHIAKRIVMESGLSLYSEILAVFASGKLGFQIDDVRNIMLRQKMEPQGFLGVIAEIQNKITFENIESSIAHLDSQIIRNLTLLRRANKNGIETVTGCVKFLKSLEFLNTLCNGNSIGDIELALIKTIRDHSKLDLLFFKCPRLVQTSSGSDIHGIDIITHPYRVNLAQSNGKRIYEGNELLISNLNYVANSLLDLGVNTQVYIIVVDSEVDDMFAQDGSIIPSSDIENSYKKCATYTQHLNRFCESISPNIHTLALSSIASGTDYAAIKAETVLAASPNHPGKQQPYNPSQKVVGERDFETEVARQLASKSKVYGGRYTRDHAIHQAARKLGDMRAIAAVVHQFQNPIILTRGPIPTKEAYLANHPDYPSARRILFVDPENLNVNTEES